MLKFFPTTLYPETVKLKTSLMGYTIKCYICQTQVTIDGAGLDHHFFSDIQDVALGLLLVRFQIFKAQRDRGTTCWPLITLNFNLPPEIHTQLVHIIPLSIIPGPKAPKDFNSFLHPFVDECKNLLQVYGLLTHTRIKHSSYMSIQSQFTVVT